MEYLIVQVTENRLNIARFNLSGKSTTVTGSTAFVLDADQDLNAAVSEIAAETSGSPRVVLCLPAAFFAQRRVELPLKDLRKVREIMPAHLQGELALPPEDVVFDVLPSGEGHYLAFWAKRSDIEHAINSFKEAGLEPAIITSVAFAWPYLPGVPAECAISDGSAVGQISGGHLSFVRPIGINDRNRELVGTLSALEYSDRGLPEQLIVTGSECADLVALEGLPIPVYRLEEPAGLSQVFAEKDSFDRLSGLYAVVMASQANSLPDFRRGDLAWTAGDAKLRRKLMLTAILTVVVIILLFGLKLLQYRQASTDLASLNGSIQKIYREIFPGRTKAVDELAEVKGEIRKLGGADNSNSVVDILKKVAEAKGNNINGVYELELEGRNLTIKGDARSAQAVNDFKTALAPLMSTIELGEVKSKPDGAVTFSLTASVKEASK